MTTIEMFTAYRSRATKTIASRSDPDANQFTTIARRTGYVISQDTIEFAHQHNIKPKTIVFEGIDKAPEAYAAMRNGDYRVVLKVATD